MKITFQTPPKNLDEKMIFNVLKDYKILNCEVLVRDENGILILAPFSFLLLLSVHYNQILTHSHSHNRRLHRRDHERPPEIHSLVRHLSIHQPTRNQAYNMTASTSTTKSTASASTSWTSSPASPTQPS